MSSSVEHGSEERKLAPNSLVGSKQPPHQPHQTVARCWLTYHTSKPSGESGGSAGYQELRRSRWDGLKPPLASRQTNRAAKCPKTKSINQTPRQFALATHG